MEDKGNGALLEDMESIAELFSPAQELMQSRVRDILLVASLYDAFIIEEDRGLSEQIFGEYLSLGISSPPRVKLVPSAEKALKELKKKRYDLVITMTHLFDTDPLEFGKKVKGIQNVPVVLLVTEVSEIRQYHSPGESNGIDRVFLWTGNSSLFLAIIKLFEDMMNVDHDTKYGDVRVILLVEDSPQYYSIFLPLMYKEIMRQTQMLMKESVNEQEMVLRKRARPKILLVETYEDALSVYKRYSEYMLGVITDVAYPRNGRKDDDAGFRLISNIDPDTPVLIQSTQADKRKKAEDFGVQFVDKNSEDLLHEFRSFLKEKLGFGNFVFRLPDSTIVGEASNIREFIEVVKKVPAESLLYHGRRNQFSAWLLARGEIELARMLRKKKISDFRDGEEVRAHLIQTFEEAERRKSRGAISDFSKKAYIYDETISRFGAGSLGGKGRGLAFLSYLFQKLGINERYEKHRFHIPSSLIIATDEYDEFIERNKLHEIRNKGLSDDEIKSIFLEGELSDELISALDEYLSHIKVPIAVRSSSLLEDSYNQPFAGVYSTYILPNTGPRKKRLEELESAIKLVYASTYFKRARAYIKTTLHTSDEDKMAIVIQKLVGNILGDVFFPIFSGVAQSYNFYPQEPLKRDDGIVNLALGLGKIVVEGGNFLTFSPKRPQVILGFSNTKEILDNSQNIFYALDMKKKDFDFLEGEDVTIKKMYTSDAEEYKEIMKWVASTYDPQDDVLRDSLDSEGYRIITFAPILKYRLYPLPEMLRRILDICRLAMGGDVEIEFAAKLVKGNPELYILQIRPLLTAKRETFVEDLDASRKERYLVYSHMALGNGILGNIKDIVFIHRESFERSKTLDIAEEIGKMNEMLDGVPYILIGHGRWGTKDRWLGIPVGWDHISNTRAMVETPIKDIKVEFSQGSHFFHNIACLNIPYLTVDSKGFIDWEWLEKQEPAHKMKYVVHVHLEKPVEIRVDGNSGKGVILKGSD